MTSLTPTVAVSADFFTSFANIPRKKQNKVLGFVNKFRTDPTASGINYEKIHDFKDKNLRSVRIDDTYRGIVLKPETGNVYMLLWVDHHDEAYAWGRNRVCSINPRTGSIQVYDVQTASASKNAQTIDAHPDQKEKTPPLFDAFRDRELLSLGIPEDLLGLVRAMKTRGDLEQRSTDLPQEVYEALFYLAEGFSLEEVFQAIEAEQQTETVDTEDFVRALEHPLSKQRFYVAEDELELMRMLEEPLEKWRVFLHPAQRKLVEREWNGPVRVLGGAGTGKTVAAMHRAKWLAENLFTGPDDRILFTTFTRNLAADIRENLSKICSDEVGKRIEVVNLDKWVSVFLRKNGYHFSVVYEKTTAPLWEKALAFMPDGLHFPASFYREEWEQVIQPGEIQSFAGYKSVPRTGRGVALNRKERKLIWPVFEEYMLMLSEQGLREPEDAMRDARDILAHTGNILPYNAVVVDEAQDMGMLAFKLLRAMVPEGKNDLFIVGDAHQRIYNKRVVLGQCGVNIIGRGRKLLTNYRTTKETGAWATALLKNVPVDDLDGGEDGTRGYTSLLHGDPPMIEHYASPEDEIQGIAEIIRAIRETEGKLRTTCVTARTKRLVAHYRSALQNLDIPVYPITTDSVDDRTREGIRMATMHRVKGLEFDYMIICGASKGTIPLEYGNAFGSHDATIRRAHQQRERSLFYVAATRAKKRLIVTGYGQLSAFVK